MCVIRCPSERALLLLRIDIIHLCCPDMIVGYNTNGWDYMFMWERIKKYIPELAAAEDEVRAESEARQAHLPEAEKRLFRGLSGFRFGQVVDALGDGNEMVRCLMNGHGIHTPVRFTYSITKFGNPTCMPDVDASCENIDLFTLIRLERSGWTGFSLDSVAQRVLKGKNVRKIKLDMPDYRREVYESVRQMLKEDVMPPPSPPPSLAEEEWKLEAEWTAALLEWCEGFRTQYVTRAERRDDVFREVSLLRVLCDPKDNYAMLFRLYESGRVSNILACCLYAAVDCDLPLRIFISEALFDFVGAISALTGLKINRVAQGTQQDRVMSGLLTMSEEKGFSTDYTEVSNPKSFQGAYVFPPRVGFYRAIFCLDFAHLYPSIIEAYRICYTTYIETRERAEAVRRLGKKVNEVHVTDTHTTYWADDADAPLPQLCILYQKERDRNKAMKKKFLKEGNVVAAQKADSTQLANKAMTNSIYGFTGTDRSKGGKIPLKDIAQSVTAKGREMIFTTRDQIVERWREILTGALPLPESMYPDRMPKPSLPPREWVELLDKLEVVYGDTDSVMVAMHGRSRAAGGDGVLDAENREDREVMNVVADVLAYWCTHCFHYGVELEKEYMGTGVFIQGKTYIMREWSTVDGGMELVRKGMKTVKRDACGVERRTHEVLERALFSFCGVEEVMKALEDALSILLRGKTFEWTEAEYVECFACSMQVTNSRNKLGNWKNDHYVTRHLDALLIPSTGDRLQYVICDVRTQKLEAEKYYPASVAFERRMHPDMLKYFEKAWTVVEQFSKAMEEWKDLEKWRESFKRRLVHKRTGQRSLADMFKRPRK